MDYRPTADYRPIVRFQPRSTNNRSSYLPHLPYHNYYLPAEQSRQPTYTVAERGYRAPLANGQQWSRCIKCSAHFHKQSWMNSTICTRCRILKTSSTKTIDVSGFSQASATSIASSVFAQPRGPQVTAREIRFNNGTVTVREEYRRI